MREDGDLCWTFTAVTLWLGPPPQRESAAHAEQFLREAIMKHGIQLQQLTLHSDHGSPMTSTKVAQLLVKLGVTKSFNRPRTSDDNCFSESQFKTMKYWPEFPDRFGRIEDAIAFCREIFPWYNNEHYHTGLALLTPRQVHQGQARRWSSTATWCWRRPTHETPNGSYANRRPRRSRPTRCGSTIPPKTLLKLHP